MIAAMSTDAPRNTPGPGWALRVAGLACLWLAVVVMMVRDDLRDPFNAALEGTARYGHNHEHALVEGILWTLSELVLLYAILRPWSYRRSWGRALGALALLVPWTGLSMVMTMHAGGIVALHFLWLLLVTLLVAGVLVIGLFGGRRG